MPNIHTSSLPDVLSCLITKDDETQLWLAHCLNLDLVTSSKTPDDAWKRLTQVIKMHVEHCFTNRHRGLEHSASDEEWADFKRVKARATPLRSEKVELNLVPGQMDEDKFVWIEGVENQFTSESKNSPVTLQPVH
jgi:hypothetical protein